MLKTMNDAVEARFGKLTAMLCEYEVITSQQQARIAELEDQLTLPRSRSKKTEEPHKA